jgi:hypothetical protein
MQPPLTHFTAPDFWSLYHRLPAHVRDAADKCFTLLKSDPRHPSLHFKKIGDLWSVRAGIHYRALGMDAPGCENGILWFWIGPHSEYDRLIKQR